MNLFESYACNPDIDMGHRCTKMLVGISSICRCRARQQEENSDDDDSGISITDDDMLHTKDMITFRNSIMRDVYDWIINNISATDQKDRHLVEDIVIHNENI